MIVYCVLSGVNLDQEQKKSYGKKTMCNTLVVFICYQRAATPTIYVVKFVAIVFFLCVYVSVCLYVCT